MCLRQVLHHRKLLPERQLHKKAKCRESSKTLSWGTKERRKTTNHCVDQKYGSVGHRIKYDFYESKDNNLRSDSKKEYMCKQRFMWIAAVHNVGVTVVSTLKD